eukprot:145559_1
MFGTTTEKNSVQNFYHGVSEKLKVAHYNDSTQLNHLQNPGVSVCGPLSTSCSFVVAANFTNESNGMVMEFTDGNLFGVRSFSCEWLSDYGNEKEYLFIQNAIMEVLWISNIYFISDGIEYVEIIYALNVIQTAICTSAGTDYVNINSVTESMKILIRSIIQDRLSSTFNEQPKFESLTQYTRDIILTYFESKTQIMMYMQKFLSENYDEFAPKIVTITTYGLQRLHNGKLSFLEDIFIERKSACARLDYIVAIFPYAFYVEMVHVALNDIFMQRLFQYLTDKSVQKTLDLLQISPSRNGWMAAEAVSNYDIAFNDIGYRLDVTWYGDLLV